MVQLKHLEKSLEAGVIEGSLRLHESVIDEYLDEHEYISVAASAKLHEVLYKLWTGAVLSRRDDGGSAGSGTLTPVSSRTTEHHATPAVPEVPQAVNAKVAFLQALVRLGPCLIDTPSLLVWWDELSVYAIDSTGHQFDIVQLSQEFIMGVLTRSFYAHADASTAELNVENAKAYGRRLLELYLSQALPKKSVGEATAERVRYARQNCRIYFGHFGRKETTGAFTMLNDFFVQPQYRLDILNLVVEYLSQSQNSKLFKVYDTAFFESLLLCLEHDKTKPVLQLALTALAMCIVHVCDKLVPTRLLFRIYACFGRACSWQSELNGAGDAQATRDDDDDDDDTESSALESEEDAGARAGEGEANSGKPGRKSSAASAESPARGWQTLTQEIGIDASAQSEETIDVLPLFTFLYGLFPQNTLLFCRQCDEYLSKHSYERTFSDFWSRFMVTKKVETLVREFRVDPLLLISTPEAELSTSVQRFQAIGSALGVTSVITSRLVSHSSGVDIHEAIEEHQRYFQALMQSDEQLLEAKSRAGTASPLASPSRTGPSSPVVSPAKLGAKLEAPAKASSEAASEARQLSEARQPSEAVEPSVKTSSAPAWGKFDDGNRSAAYWRRELLLLRNELAFTDFRRHMSEQRSLRWQKRASRWAIAELKNDELTRQNQLMEAKVAALREETQRALRSARTIMRERSAYETKILDRNREFRDQITTLENRVRELLLDAEAARHAEAALSALNQENEEKAGTAELQLRALRNDVDASRRQSVDSAERESVAEQTQQTAVGQSDDAKFARIHFEIENLKQERDAAVALMEREVAAAQAAAARAQHEQRQAGKRAAVDASADAVARENLAAVARLRRANEELLHRCVSVEHELRARKVHEEERMNELQAALMSARAFAPLDPPAEGRFRGRGGAQGVPRRA